MIAALFLDPACDVGATPAGSNHQIRPWSREHSGPGALQTKARRAKDSEEEIVQMNEPGETQSLDFVWPTERVREPERLCGVSRVIIGQYPDSGIAVEATASFA
jgi:hypothetical protein